MAIIYFEEYKWSSQLNQYIDLGIHRHFMPDLEFGSIENYKERDVWYDGDADTGIIIQIHAIGPAEFITIYNVITREQMAIDTDKLATLMGGVGIVAGDEITISTVKGNKYIQLLRNGHTYNILNALNKNCDWFQLTKGDNVFTYVATSGSANLQFKILNQIAFEGV